MAKQKMDKPGMEEFLRRAEVGHLATLGPEGPYLVPLHFLYRGGSIYFHCGLKGRKLDNIKKDPRVCFQAEEMTAIVPHERPCSYNTRYTSVLVEGTARVVTDAAEKMSLLEGLAAKYKENPSLELDPEAAARTLVVEIAPRSFSGKRNP